MAKLWYKDAIFYEVSIKAFYDANGDGLGDINGLTTLGSPDGKAILYGDSNLSLFIYHLDPRETESVGVRTLPEKCVWAGESIIYCAVPTLIAPAQYPDAWYQGEISFSDQIWGINTESGETSLISDPISVPGGESLDAWKLKVDESGRYLFFLNKKDSSFWELELW